MSTVEDRVLTPDDLLERREYRHCELVDGQLVEKHMSGQSVWVGGRVHTTLDNFVTEHSAGVVFTDGQGYQCFAFDASLLRKPDASFIRRGRLSKDEFVKGHFRIAPDIMVEVVSPGDEVYELEQRVDDFLEAGTALCWVFNPDRRAVTIYRQDGTIERIGDDGTLTGENVLPGFACPVAEFFPPVDLAKLL